MEKEAVYVLNKIQKDRALDKVLYNGRFNCGNLAAKLHVD